MVTIFEQLLFTLTAAGIVLGGICGGDLLGPIGALIGSILGAKIGWRIGGVPSELMRFYLVRFQVRPKTDDALLAELWTPGCPCSSLVLAELGHRGYDVYQELGKVYKLLIGESMHDRFRGWNILWEVYPVIAKGLSGYHPASTLAECIEKTNILRVTLDQDKVDEVCLIAEWARVDRVARQN